MSAQDQNLRAIWKQSKIPVVYRQGGKDPLLVRLPYEKDNRAWLKENPRQKEPEFFKKYECWRIPKSRFDTIIEKALVRYGRVYAIQPYRVLEICTSSCMKASGFECECSCMGANHGAGIAGSWYEISETLAVKWHTREYACRLIVRSEVEQPVCLPGAH